MKTTIKTLAILMFVAATFVSCQSDDPAPIAPRVTSIAVQEGRYDVYYNADGSVSEIKYTEGSDVQTHRFSWSDNNHKLTMVIDNGENDLVLNTFEYLDVLVNGEPKTVLYKVIYDNDGHDDGQDNGKLVQVDYVAAPNQSIPSIVENVRYDYDYYSDISNFSDASWTMAASQLTLGYTTNNEVVKVNFNNSVDAWWTNLPAEITAALFENEFYYPYFFSLKEVTTIVNTYDVKETPDYNDAFEYQYNSDGTVASIKSNANQVSFTWE